MKVLNSYSSIVTTAKRKFKEESNFLSKFKNLEIDDSNEKEKPNYEKDIFCVELSSSNFEIWKEDEYLTSFSNSQKAESYCEKLSQKYNIPSWSVSSDGGLFKLQEEETLSRKEKLDLISKLTGKKFSSEKDALNYKDYENKNWEKIKELQKSLKESFLKRKIREAEGSGDGLLSDDIIEDLRTCNMSLQMVCMALKDNATEQTLIDTFHLSPAETKIVANALKFIKKEITLVDVNSTPNTEVMKVSGTVYITVPDATGLKLLFSDNQNLLKRLVSLQGFLNTPQRTTTSISVPMFMEKRNFRKRSFKK